MEIETLHHVSLSVTDLERARLFCGGVLGLEEIERPAFDFPVPGSRSETGNSTSSCTRLRAA